MSSVIASFLRPVRADCPRACSTSRSRSTLGDRDGQSGLTQDSKRTQAAEMDRDARAALPFAGTHGHGRRWPGRDPVVFHKMRAGPLQGRQASGFGNGTRTSRAVTFWISRETIATRGASSEPLACTAPSTNTKRRRAFGYGERQRRRARRSTLQEVPWHCRGGESGDDRNRPVESTDTGRAEEMAMAGPPHVAAVSCAITESLRQVADAVAETAWMVELCDPAWRLVWISPELCKQLGADAPERLGLGGHTVASRALEPFARARLPEAGGRWLKRNVPFMIEDTDGGRAAIRDMVPEGLMPFVDAPGRGRHLRPARAASAARSAWTAGRGSRSSRGWATASRFPSARCCASSTGRPRGDRGRPRPSVRR